jgi:hypothetical protein
MGSNNLCLRLFLTLKAVTKSKPDKPVSITEDVARIAALVEAFLSAPVFAAATHAKVDDDPVTTVTPKTRAKQAALGRKLTIQYFDHERPESNVWAEFSFSNTMAEVRVVLEGALLAEHRATALDDLVTSVQRAVDAWRGGAVATQGHIKAEYYGGAQPPYARTRPPRRNIRYPERSLVTFFDLALHQSGDAFANPSELAALTEPPPPAPAVVTTDNGLTMVRWTKTLDDDAIAAASAGHHRWIRRIDTDLDRDFNAEGDQVIPLGNAKPLLPLTFYNPYMKAGFKTVLVLPDGEPEASAWDEARTLIQTHALPDGKPLDILWVIVPLREHAIALHSRAVEAGFKATLYPDRYGRFWDPLPPGPWLPEDPSVSENVRQ